MSSTTAPPSHEQELRAIFRRLRDAQKPPAQGSPAYSRFVNRKAGRLLATVAYRTGLTPNHVTTISAALSAVAIAAVALVPPSPVAGLLIAVGLLLGYAFDSADGQLARLRGGGTPAGEWFDHVVDSAKTVSLHLAVLIGWFRFVRPAPGLLLVPLGFAVVTTVMFFALILTDQMRRAHPRQMPRPAGSNLTAVLRSALVIPTDYGVLCLIFLAYGWPLGFGVAYTVLFAGTTVFLAAALPKWYREMARLGG